MRISIIVPVYNTAQYLRKCVESLTHQTYSELEIILVNDGSTDDSLKIMRQLQDEDGRVIVVDNEHGGVSKARNLGLEKATGTYVSFIDSDDWLELDTYEILMDILCKYDADAVYYEWLNEYSDGSTETNRESLREMVYEEEEILRTYFDNKVYFNVSSSLMKLDMARDVRYAEELEAGEDMLFSFQTLCNAKRVVCSDRQLYHRYNRVGSLSNRRGFIRSDIGMASCTDYMIDIVKEKKPELVLNVYAYSFTFYMIILNKMLYYHAEEENQDIYQLIRGKLSELIQIQGIKSNIPTTVHACYVLYKINKEIYRLVVKVYLRYIKRELDTKRQK